MNTLARSSKVDYESRGTARTVRPRPAFTLVELMIVIVVIGILSSIFLAALDKAEQTSKAARTNSLVQKLHNIIMGRWDAYRTVRLPINADSRVGNMANAGNEAQSRFRQDVARRRMLAMRELLRMEMPDRYEDLTFIPSVYVSPFKQPIRPYLWSAYQRRIMTAKSGNAATKNLQIGEYLREIAVSHESAECLYLIITTGVDDSSLSTEHFSPRDFGDADHDGMPEFHDAWGNPINFLRWAPGFVSPMQPIYRYASDDPRTSIFDKSQPRDPDNLDDVLSRWKIQIERATDTNSSPAKVVDRIVIIDQDDPFNPMRVGPIADEIPSSGWSRSKRWRPGDVAPEHGYLLMPLIYSNGQDYESGIDHCFGYRLSRSPSMEMSVVFETIPQSDPYNLYEDTGNGTVKYRGVSLRDGRDFDNIHNHQVATN